MPDLQSSVTEELIALFVMPDLQSATPTDDASQLALRTMRITNPRLNYAGLQIQRDGVTGLA